MSLLRWFSRKPEAEAAPSSSLRDSTRPPKTTDTRRGERSARRERLYAVVRQSMANAGVLSSSYRFKVLSLDGRGRQFLVMVDLVGTPGDAADLRSIEAAMQHAAKAQHDILVKAVYWRDAPAAAATRPSAPSASQARSSGGGQQRAAAVVEAPPVQEADPLLAEEIAAFRQALASGTERPAGRGFDAGDRNYTLLTGFEDTEIRPGLSVTQHGELR